MRKILFVLMAAAMLVSCDSEYNQSADRFVPFRVKHTSSAGDISIVYADSALRLNDTVWINSYHKYVVLLERVK